jgi:hypothetical protein
LRTALSGGNKRKAEELCLTKTDRLVLDDEIDPPFVGRASRGIGASGASLPFQESQGHFPVRATSVRISLKSAGRGSVSALTRLLSPFNVRFGNFVVAYAIVLFASSAFDITIVGVDEDVTGGACAEATAIDMFSKPQPRFVFVLSVIKER